MAEKGKIVVDGKFVVLLVALVILATSGSALLTSRLLAQPNVDGLIDKDPEFGPRVEFDTIVVNLKTNGNRSNQYLRLKMTVEFNTEKIPTEFENYKTVLQDKTIEILRNKTAEDLVGGDGQVLLRQEIRKAFNEILPNDPVMSVYFTEFLIS
ncbi:MAG: flagellar basal body-associated FliL family protein [Firmicutes bacterium]|nr:flagellar basal body-associated FliL family protein [Bacillota bacterium]MDD4263576.1 flagellar basal body-associated FliL family protein [Bacillota bacterium]MDD4694439.1 flagellar basal body-associated FliL family protein [Bacillota bacterium]